MRSIKGTLEVASLYVSIEKFLKVVAMHVTQAARVKTLRHEAKGILGIELLPEGGQEFAPFTAGAHIDLHLPNGLVRSYSLMNSPDEHNRYVVGVLNDRNSRGGSRWLHEHLKLAATLTISQPRNNFALDEEAPHTVLVAGGIGITPLYSMVQRLINLGKSVELIYCARSRKEAALLAELETLSLPVIFHFDDECGASPDLQALLSNRETSAHFYCCGPAPMLDAFERAAAALGYSHVHTERFAAPVPEDDFAASEPQTYEAVLNKSGQTFTVPAGDALLDVLLDAGVDVEYSCCEGICGACETTVLEGEIEHRDGVLSQAQRDSNNVMMICVSGCKSGRLVLDL